MNSPTSCIYSVQQVRALERDAIAQQGVTAAQLMERAGAAAFAVLQQRWPTMQRCLIVCGYGNNAGDGYVMARLALQAQWPVTVVALLPPEQLHGAAAQAWQAFARAGGAACAWDTTLLAEAEVIVDAILGTGLSRPLDAALSACVQAINATGRPIFSLDVPSGLHADTGQVLGVAVQASCTLSFIGLKQGFYLGEGPDYTGTVLLDDLNCVSTAAVEHVAQRLTPECVTRALPPRRRTTHKTQQGRVLIVGGGVGMAGAVRLAGEACLRVGAGLVTVATHPDNVIAVTANCPELICHGISHATQLQALLATTQVVAVGPGLGVSAWAAELYTAVLGCDVPLVVDADALNLLAQHPMQRAHWVLTPHPGEAARLLFCTPAAVQADRFAAVRGLLKGYGGIQVLKGAGTVVAAAGQPLTVCDRGNPAMATPGMGDVLTGVIAGIAAQSMGQQADLVDVLWRAACAGVYVHATAGDRAVHAASPVVTRGLLARDVVAQLPFCM